MELVDRYLKTVKQFLPSPQRDDIVHELSDDMRSQIENKEAELGRPLDEHELAVILEQYGHPYVLAGKYQCQDQSLSFGGQIIGPTLFPFYAKVLAINLSISVLVVAGLMMVWSLSGHAFTSTTMLWGAFHLLMQFGIITVIFVLVQRQLKRASHEWDPLHPERVFESRSSANRVSRFGSIAQLISIGALLFCMESVARSNVTADLREAGLQLGVVWRHAHFVLLGIFGVSLLQAVVNLIRPDWIGFNRSVRVGGAIVWILLCLYVLVAGNWIMPVSPTSLPDEKVRALATFNLWFFWSLLVTTLVSAIFIGADTYYMLRRR